MRGFLYGLFALGLLVNIWSNFSTYRQAQLAIENNETLTRSFKVLHQIDLIKLGTHALQKKETSVSEVQAKISELAILTQLPDLSDEVSKLSALSESDLVNSVAENLLGEIETTEKSLINSREDEVNTSNLKSIQRIMYSSTIDFLLIIVTFASFIFEKQFAAKMQRALSSALSHVEAVNDSLKRNILKKESLLKTTVHDLKNPLGSIRGFAEILAEEPEDKKSVIEMTQIIQRISNNALVLVGSLLESAEKTELASVEKIKILDCLKETCAFLEPSMRKKGQKIQFENNSCDFSFRGSRQQIQDIFYNIVRNALKFSPPHSVVTVGCIAGDGYHEVKVKDRGPGFAAADFSKMFSPGEKLSAQPTGGEDSTGIGLYSVKQAVEKFHGKIEVTNNETLGACVSIQFPAMDA